MALDVTFVTTLRQRLHDLASAEGLWRRGHRAADPVRLEFNRVGAAKCLG
jgi:hypothetical protein